MFPQLYYLHSLSIRLCACSLPPSFPFSFSRWLPPPSRHVGSSLRLYFSCLGSLLSSPANKSSANLLPESLCPCSDCSSPPLLGNTAAEEGLREPERKRKRERERESERARGEGWWSATKWPSAVQKQQASLSECVPESWRFSPAPSFPFSFPQCLTVRYCEAGEETNKRRRRMRKNDSIGHCCVCALPV